MHEMQNALLASPFNRISIEILTGIFQLLSVPDLCNVSLVYRLFKNVADQDEIWKFKCNSKNSDFFLASFYYDSLKMCHSLNEIIFQIIQTNLHGLEIREIFTQ